MYQSKLKSICSAASLFTIALASNASAAGSPPYQFAGDYEFSNCTENVEAYVAIAVAAGTINVATSNGTVQLDTDGLAKHVRVPFPLTCNADGSLNLTNVDMSNFSAEVQNACDVLFPIDDEVTLSLNNVLCPAIEAGMQGIVEEAQSRTPQFLVTAQNAQIEELTGYNRYYRWWAFGAYEGMLRSDNTTKHGNTFEIDSPIQDYGRINQGRNVLDIDLIGMLSFAGGTLLCGYGSRDVAEPYFYSGYQVFSSEYRHGFECGAEYNGQNIAIEIAPIYKVEYQLNKIAN